MNATSSVHLASGRSESRAANPSPPPCGLPEGTLDEGRYELKFRIPSCDIHKIDRVLAGNARPFLPGGDPVSCVHSIYFDDHRLSGCREVLAGTSQRVKLRLRWYDTALPQNQAFFEMKFRERGLRRKRRIPIPNPERLPQLSYSGLIRELRDLLDPECAKWLMARPYPTVLVSYQRRHYRCTESPVRITLDYNVTACEQNRLRPSCTFPVSIADSTVLEAKAPPGHGIDVRRLLSPLRLRLASNSKYVQCCRAVGLFRAAE